MANKFISIFGQEIFIGNYIGFDKTVAKNKVMIYGEVVSLNDENRTITIKTHGYKGNPDIDKKKFKESYDVPEKKAISLIVTKI